MTALEVETLVLPEPYASGEFGAWTEYSKRKVSITLKEPGTLHRNVYVMAWIDVTEQQPWRGEPLWVSGSRRPTDDRNWQRASFTDAGRKAMAAELLPLIARYGFSRWWLELHAEKGAQAAQAGRSGAAEAAKVQRWYEAQTEIGELYAERFVDVVPLAPTPIGQRDPRIPYVDSSVLRQWGWATPTARLLLDDEHVGWLTTDGKILPLWSEGT